MATDDVLLARIKQYRVATVSTLTKGLIYSDDETIHERLLFYREAGLVSFGGKIITDRTVIRAGSDRRERKRTATCHSR